MNGHEGIDDLFAVSAVGAVASRLSAPALVSAPQDSALAAEQQAQLDALLGRVPVELQAFWGRTRLLVREFIGLQPGDVITLQRMVGEDLELRIAGGSELRGQPGLVGRKLAIQIMEVL